MARPYSDDGASSVSSATDVATGSEALSADDDIWGSDQEHDSAASRRLTGQPQVESLLSDLPSVKRQHMNDGYREGLSLGKAKVMQQGFDDGYPVGVMIALRAGKVLGTIEGVLTAKDASDTQKAAVRKTYEQARVELMISSLLKDMNDQVLTESKSVPASIENTLRKWETVTFGTTSVSEDSAKSHA